jgi:hypothetical protein
MVKDYTSIRNIPPLLMLDDAIAISECGPESVKVNALIQSKVDMKSLRSGHAKCFKMHVGKNAAFCPVLKVQGFMEKLEKIAFSDIFGPMNKPISAIKVCKKVNLQWCHSQLG